jgi:uncharacterized membrane protein
MMSEQRPPAATGVRPPLPAGEHPRGGADGASRTEVFVDAAFAFATTMLVIAIDEIPGSYPELLLALKGVPAFLTSFVIIMVFWWGHKNWSRRYGLDDDPVCTLLSLALVFVVMVYLYPLKVLMTAMFAWFTRGWLPAGISLTDPHAVVGVFRIYGIGFAALSLCLGLLYWRSRALAERLALDPREKLTAELEASIWFLLAATGVVSTLWAVFVPLPLGLLAGSIYMTLFPTTFAVSAWYKRALGRLEAGAS